MKCIKSLATAAVVGLFASGCTFKDVATNENFNGLKDMHGNAVTHMNYYRLGLNFFFTSPMVNEATLNATLAELTADAKVAGNGKVRIVQSDASSYWWVFPPFSFLFTPVTADLAADVSK